MHNAKPVQDASRSVTYSLCLAQQANSSVLQSELGISNFQHCAQEKIPKALIVLVYKAAYLLQLPTIYPCR